MILKEYICFMILKEYICLLFIYLFYCTVGELHDVES